MYEIIVIFSKDSLQHKEQQEQESDQTNWNNNHKQLLISVDYDARNKAQIDGVNNFSL